MTLPTQAVAAETGDAHAEQREQGWFRDRLPLQLEEHVAKIRKCRRKGSHS